MNEQDVLNKAYPILMKQGEQSVNNHGCYYRHPDKKLVCFVGAVIPDEDYEKKFENVSLAEVVNAVPCLKDVNINFLAEGQNIHDSCTDSQWWPERYAKLAKKWKLTLPEV